MLWRRGHKVPRDERTERNAAETEAETSTSKTSRVGTRAIRKKTAAPRVPLAFHVKLRRFGNQDAGAKGQDNNIELRASIYIDSYGCLIECPREVYL